MYQKALLIVFALAAVPAISLPVTAQERRPAERPLVLRVTPRSFLDPGNVVAPNSINPGYSGYGQTQSYLLNPPYGQNNERFGGASVLPDPVTNGPFVGARNPFGPIDYVAPRGLGQ